MGVYITGMEMPKSCTKCDFRIGRFCPYLSKWADNVEQFTEDGQHDPNCPLVPVPPHGRLIDADALYSHIKDEQRKCNDPYDGWSECQVALGFVNTAPTIIPAEEGE